MKIEIIICWVIIMSKIAYIRADRELRHMETYYKCVRENAREHLEKKMMEAITRIRKEFDKQASSLIDKKTELWNAWSLDKKNTLRKADYMRQHLRNQKIVKCHKVSLQMCQRTKEREMREYLDELYHTHYAHEGPLMPLVLKRDDAFKAWKQRLPVIVKRAGKAIGVSKAMLCSKMEDVCGICMDTHDIKDTVVTCCQHQFGEKCLEQWSHVCKRANKVMSCPLCKKEKPRLGHYVEKAVDKKVEKVVEKKAAVAKKPVRGKGAIGDAEYLLAMSKWVTVGAPKAVKAAKVVVLKKPVRGKGAIGDAEYLLAMIKWNSRPVVV